MLTNFAKQVASYGVEHVFGIPGSGTSLTLIDGLIRHGVDFHLTHFEGSAAIMAGTVGRLSGKAGVSISIKGPGLYNMVAGMGASLLDAHPLVSIAEAYGPDVPVHKAHKRLNHEALVSGVSKGRFCLSAESDFSSLARFAEAEVPGPVHLDLAAPGEGDKVCPPDLSSSRMNPDERVLDLVASSNRPVVICGSWALRKGLSNELNQLSCPVFSTAAAKGIVDETLDHAAGVYTGAGGELVVEKALLDKADLVVGLGLRHNESLGVEGFSATFVAIDEVGAEVCDGFEPTFVSGWDADFSTSLFQGLKDKSWGAEIIARYRSQLRSRLLGNDFLPAHLFDAVNNHFGGAARLVLDTGLFCVIGEHMWDVRQPDMYVASGQGRSMGVGLPQAIGSAVADSSIPTVLFTGDGGLGMFAAEIKLAVQLNLPVVVILCSDGMLGTLRGRAEKDGLAMDPLMVPMSSWLDVMKAFGAEGQSVSDCDEAIKALGEWNRQGPLFLEANFNPDLYRGMVVGVR